MLPLGTLAFVFEHWICMHQGPHFADGAWVTQHSGLCLLPGSMLPCSTYGCTADRQLCAGDVWAAE